MRNLQSTGLACKLMAMSDFDRTQQSLEIVFGHIDDLMDQGKSRSDAISHAAQRFGVPRHKLVALDNDRYAGYIGQSGDTMISVSDHALQAS